MLSASRRVGYSGGPVPVQAVVVFLVASNSTLQLEKGEQRPWSRESGEKE